MADLTVTLEMASTQVAETSVSTNNSPSQDHTNPDDQPITNVSLNQQQSFSGLHQPGRSTNHKRQSQPTTVLLRTTPTRTINQPQTSVSTNNSPSQDYTNPDDQPTTNVSLNQQQSFSGLHQPGRTINQPQTSVSTNNSPSQDYTNPDDQPTTSNIFKWQFW